MPDFSTLLSAPADSIQKPKLLPTGDFHGIIKKYELTEANNDDKTPILRIQIQVTSPGEDIDPSDLDGINLSDRMLRKEYWLQTDTLFRVVELIKSLGIDTAGRSLDELIPEIVGHPVIMGVGQRPSKDGTEFFQEVRKLSGEPS